MNQDNYFDRFRAKLRFQTLMRHQGHRELSEQETAEAIFLYKKLWPSAVFNEELLENHEHKSKNPSRS